MSHPDQSSGRAETRVRRIEIPDYVPTGWRVIYFYAKDEDALALEIKAWLDGYYARRMRDERSLRGSYDGWEDE